MGLKVNTSRYRRSAELLRKAERVIPLGTQTFSKCKTQFPPDACPLFLDRGEGGRVWDVDGNEYVDMICALLPVMLGYRDRDVDEAIRRQLERGISFSLATELESDLAQRLVDLIPCAEMVRFGKNGSDATTGCVRIARASTGRDRIAVCGYHGWHDWYLGATTRNKGIPEAVSNLTHRVAFNDVKAVDELFCAHPGEFAAIVLEPISALVPDRNYFQDLISVVHGHGSLVIFDEVVTGFRYARGGAQEYFGVTPDLAAFGKGMGNGMPISAIVGKEHLMREMEEVFFSSTFGGESLSLAASIAVIDKLCNEPVVETIWKTGEILWKGIVSILERYQLSDVIKLVGLAPLSILDFRDHPKARKEAIRTLFLEQMLLRGVLIARSHNVCYAHDSADVTNVLAAYEGTLMVIREELETGELESRLKVPLIQPVFSVR